jgi:3-hydroxyisobutyrate dehydrogenase-like beta-hydroxyacid dehydrogenase
MIGFIGMGVMGARMARHLAGWYDVLVWNRTPEKAEAVEGAKVAGSLQELAESCDEIFICVSKTEDVREVLAALKPHLRENALIVDHSTIEPKAAKEIAEEFGNFIDAPVTGGEKGAIEGSLTIFCGGERDQFERARLLMETYSKRVRLVGDSGSGQMMKMANQISVVGCVLAMAECLAFAERAGLDLAETIELVGSGAGGSWSMTNYGPKVVERDWSPGFSIDLQQKDIRYALAAAEEMGLKLPGTELVHRMLASLQEQGRGGEATPALFEEIAEPRDSTENARSV